MNLETLYTVSQILASIVVVATLVAILVQMNQTNKIARADMTLQVWMQTGAMQHALADSPEKADFVQRMLSGAPLSDSERVRATYVMSVAIGTHEAAHNLRVRGLIEDFTYNRLAATTRLYMRSPAMRAMWSNVRKQGIDPRFRDLVDGMVAEIEGTESAPEARVAQP